MPDVNTFTGEFAKLTTPNEIIMDAMRAAVRDRLAERTDAQRAFFDKIHPKGIESLREVDLKCTLGLANRTLAKNRAGLRQ